MKIRKSCYFDDFACIASACPDSCCKEWSVTVDPDSVALYRSLPGALGHRLQQVLTEEDGDIVMTIEDGRCPMWQQDGLCRIQAELGHDALCATCRQFPRLTHDYGDFQEWGLELSCPEAARLILSDPPGAPVITEAPGGEPPQYDLEAMEVLLRTREEMLRLLRDDLSAAEKLAMALLYGYHAQGELDCGDALPFDEKSALDTAKNFARSGNKRIFIDFFKDLEILTPTWRQRLNAPLDSVWTQQHVTLMGYFVERYWLQAVSDYDLVGRVKLGIISCLAVKLLGGDTIQTAQLYSKEIENDPDNVEALLDAAYRHPAFTDEKLLDLLLN